MAIFAKQFSKVGFIILLSSYAYAQRDTSEAKAWLKWSSERRETYVLGYIQGDVNGFVRGCQEGTRNVLSPPQSTSEGLPMEKCMSRRLDFGKGVDLAKDVTTFYLRYPENRDLLIRELLEELGKGKTISQIHNDPPFPALTPPAK